MNAFMTSDPEAHVKAPGRHHRVIEQRVIDADVAVHLRPHRDRLQHGVDVNQGGVIQGRTDLRDRRAGDRQVSVAETETSRRQTGTPFC